MSFFNESFWLAACFLIFLYFAYRPIKRSIIKALNTRIDLIKAQLLEAQVLKDDAQVLLDKTEQQLNQLSVIRAEMIAKAESSAAFFSDKRYKEIESLLEQKKSEAIDSMNNQRAQTYNQLKIELMSDVKKLVTEYFKASNNASLSDIEIAKYLNKKE